MATLTWLESVFVIVKFAFAVGLLIDYISVISSLPVLESLTFKRFLMDPHSRLSQYNQRPPKAGPTIPNQRHMDSLGKFPSLDGFAKQSQQHTRQSRARHRKLSLSLSSPSSPTSPDDLFRPIATNSRIKQGERLRKDMYLAFVNNALQQKTLVRNLPFSILTSFIHKHMWFFYAGE